MQAKRFEVACASVSSEFYSDLRTVVLGEIRPTGKRLSVREREVQEAHRRATTCPGLMALLREGLGGALATIAARAPTSRARWLGPDHHDVALADQEWVLSWRDGMWKIDVGNALGQGLDKASR
ncbi:MAG TPA: hypothetical protein VNT03_09485 [Baekduia sp.]|nr:hypothetical protein [Baekduia sp.]